MCVGVEYSGKGWDVAFRIGRKVEIEQEGKDGLGPYLDSEMDGEPGAAGRRDRRRRWQGAN